MARVYKNGAYTDAEIDGWSPITSHEFSDNWRNIPVMEFELQEDVTRIDITEIDGMPFEFERIMFSVIFPVLSEENSSVSCKLCIAPKYIANSYNGLECMYTNGNKSGIVTGIAELYRECGVWVAKGNSAISNSWVSAVSSIGKHLRNVDDVHSGIQVFADVVSIKHISILPYAGFIQAGTKFKIFGKPV